MHLMREESRPLNKCACAHLATITFSKALHADVSGAIRCSSYHMMSVGPTHILWQQTQMHLDL